MTWEEAVRNLRSKPENAQSILENYFEEDLWGSAERFFNSEEFRAVYALIPASAQTLLDIGAGRGIASYAFAKKGLQVTALEPDPSQDVGAGAIRFLAEKGSLKISVNENFGESLPYENKSFDVVYARQVLHHAQNLKQFHREVFRVLKPGGIYVATREHVLSKPEDLQQFLNRHPLHKLYGGENAFTLTEYLTAIQEAGLQLKTVLHPYASVINFAPATAQQIKQNFVTVLGKILSKPVANILLGNDAIYRFICNLKARQDNTPGRLYSFVATKV